MTDFRSRRGRHFRIRSRFRRHRPDNGYGSEEEELPTRATWSSFTPILGSQTFLINLRVNPSPKNIFNVMDKINQKQVFWLEKITTPYELKSARALQNSRLGFRSKTERKIFISCFLAPKEPSTEKIGKQCAWQSVSICRTRRI
jgi:hypothetical protein